MKGGYVYPSAVSAIEVINAKDRTLSTVLRDYLSRKFTGYITYVNELAGIYVYLAIVNGEISACRSLDKNTVKEGLKCIDLASSITKSTEGIIEVYGSNVLSITRDILLYPLSRVKETSEVISKLQIEKTTATVTETRTMVPEELFTGANITDECIDPVLLYSIIKLSKLLEVSHEALTISEITRKTRRIISSEKPKYVYLSGDTGKAHVKIVFDVQNNNLSIEVSENSVVDCGKTALNKLIKASISNVKVWIVT